MGFFRTVAFVGFAVAFSTASPQSFLRVETGGHSSQIQALERASDGSLVSASWDKTVRLWDEKSGEARGVLRYRIAQGTEDQAVSLSTSPQGLVAVGAVGIQGGEARAYIFDVKTKQVVRQLSEFKDRVNLAFVSGGSKLLTLDGQGTLSIWDTATWSKTASGSVDGAKGKSLVFVAAVADGSRVVVAHEDGAGSKLIAIDASSLKPVGAGASLKGRVFCLEAAGSGVVFGGDSGLLGSWDLSGAPKAFDAPAGVVTAVAQQGDSVAIALFGAKASVERWSAAGKKVGAVADSPAPVTALFWASSEQVVIGNALGQMQNVDARTGKLVAGLDGPGSPVATIAWSKDGSSICWGDSLLAADRAKPSKGNLKYNFDFGASALTTTIGELSAGPEATATIVPTVKGSRVEFKSGDIRVVETGYPGGPNAVAVLSPTELATAYGPEVRVYRLVDRTMKLVASLTGSEGYVLSLAVSPDGRFLAGASTDKTVRIWNIEESRGESTKIINVPSVMTLYAGKDGEWVVWNDAKSFYAASPKGDENLAIQTNLPTGGADLVTAYSRRAVYYRPDLIQELFKTGSIPAEASSLAPMAQTQADCPQIRPVEVRGAKLQDGQYVASGNTVEIVVRVTQDIESVSLSENNISKKIKRDGLEGPASDLRVVRATLRPGLNKIRLVATNKAGEGNAIMLPIRLESGQATTNSFKVLTIGVSKYTARDISPLPYNRNDADSVGKFFSDQNGLIGDVKVTNVAEDQTTGAGIRAAVEAFAKSIEQQDTVVVYVSAHGAPGPGGKGFYMLPSDTDTKAIDKTGISWDWLIAKLSELDCKNVVLLQDTCHAGGARIAQIENAVARNIAARSARETNLITFSSCQPNELSQVSTPDKMSVFTLALLTGLQGKLPGAIKDGFVQLERLEFPIKDEVSRILQRLITDEKLPPGSGQSPSMTKLADVELPIAKVKKTP